MYIRSRKKCIHCEKEISLSNYSKHVNSCKTQRKYKFQLSNDIFLNGVWHCPNCDFIGKTKQSVSSHYYRRHTEDGLEFNPNINNIGKPSWNKGLTKETHPSIARGSEKYKQGCSEGRIIPHLKYVQNLQPSDRKEEKLKWKRRRQIKEKDQQGNIIYLDSNYERTVLKELNKNDIRWIRPTSSIPYVDNDGTNRSYTPDFYLSDYDVYLDPKNNLLIERSGNLFDLVVDQNKIKLLILRKNELSWRVIKSKIDKL